MIENIAEVGLIHLYSINLWINIISSFMCNWANLHDKVNAPKFLC